MIRRKKKKIIALIGLFAILLLMYLLFYSSPLGISICTSCPGGVYRIVDGVVQRCDTSNPACPQWKSTGMYNRCRYCNSSEETYIDRYGNWKTIYGCFYGEKRLSDKLYQIIKKTYPPNSVIQKGVSLTHDTISKGIIHASSGDLVCDEPSGIAYYCGGEKAYLTGGIMDWTPSGMTCAETTTTITKDEKIEQQVSLIGFIPLLSMLILMGGTVWFFMH